jgi:hypothetical protein
MFTLEGLKQRLACKLREERNVPKEADALTLWISKRLSRDEINFIEFLRQEEGDAIIVGWLSETLLVSGRFKYSISA